jgi:hypothetical protein
MFIENKSKKLLKLGFEPKTSSISSGCLNRYASSVLEIDTIVTVYDLEVGDERPVRAQPPAPAITSPGRASTWIYLKPRWPAAKNP